MSEKAKNSVSKYETRQNKLIISLNNFYFRLGAALSGSAATIPFLDFSVPSKVIFSSLLASLGVGILHLAGYKDNNTVMAYVRTRMLYDKFGKIDDEHFDILLNSGYCPTKGLELAVFEIAKKDPLIYEQWLRACERNKVVLKSNGKIKSKT